jgi:hypothetical protein
VWTMIVPLPARNHPLIKGVCWEPGLQNRHSLHIFRSHRATDVGLNRTQVPMRNDGILPAFACLKIVILETVNMLASSSAVKASRSSRPQVGRYPS